MEPVKSLANALLQKIRHPIQWGGLFHPLRGASAPVLNRYRPCFP
jgi:hypothetical protein